MLLPEQVLFGYCYTRFILPIIKFLTTLHILNIKAVFHIAAFQWRIQGRGPGGPLPPPPLFLDQTEAQRAAKNLFFLRPPPPPTFLSEGLDLPLHLAPSTRPRTFLKPHPFLPGLVWMWPNGLNQFRERFQKDEVLERYINRYIFYFVSQRGFTQTI